MNNILASFRHGCTSKPKIKYLMCFKEDTSTEEYFTVDQAIHMLNRVTSDDFKTSVSLMAFNSDSESLFCIRVTGPQLEYIMPKGLPYLTELFHALRSLEFTGDTDKVQKFLDNPTAYVADWEDV